MPGSRFAVRCSHILDVLSASEEPDLIVMFTAVIWVLDCACKLSFFNPKSKRSESVLSMLRLEADDMNEYFRIEHTNLPFVENGNQNL